MDESLKKKEENNSLEINFKKSEPVKLIMDNSKGKNEINNIDNNMSVNKQNEKKNDEKKNNTIKDLTTNNKKNTNDEKYKNKSLSINDILKKENPEKIETKKSETKKLENKKTDIEIKKETQPEKKDNKKMDTEIKKETQIEKKETKVNNQKTNPIEEKSTKNENKIPKKNETKLKYDVSIDNSLPISHLENINLSNKEKNINKNINIELSQKDFEKEIGLKFKFGTINDKKPNNKNETNIVSNNNSHNIFNNFNNNTKNDKNIFININNVKLQTAKDIPFNDIKETKKEAKIIIEKKEDKSLLREIGNYFSSTVDKISKYNKNRIDNKKESFFEDIINNKSTNLRDINGKLLFKNIISGVPNKYRGRFWLRSIGNQLAITPDYFDINLAKYYEKNEEGKELEYKLPFPYLGIFKEGTPLTSDLCEVIHAFLISRPDIVYNEKISYLVGMLLINMDKYQAYVSFMNLILNPNIIIYYLTSKKNEKIMEYGYNETPRGDEPDIKNETENERKIPAIVEKNLRRVVFKQLLFNNLPDLCSHLELLNVLPEDYFDEWNETIFCKNFNVDLSMKIWDLFVVQGEKIIFDAGIAILKELQDDILDCEEKEEVLEILLKSQMREINEQNILNELQKVDYPEWIQAEVINMTENVIIPISFTKN